MRFPFLRFLIAITCLFFLETFKKERDGFVNLVAFLNKKSMTKMPSYTVAQRTLLGVPPGVAPADPTLRVGMGHLVGISLN